MHVKSLEENVNMNHIGCFSELFKITMALEDGLSQGYEMYFEKH